MAARETIAFSNLDKVLYPGGSFTKGDVINYYRQVAPTLLPHFKARPVTLVRYPDGVFKNAFYEKNAPGFTPDWVKTFPVPRVEGGYINYILINNQPTLLWVANLAALELHPFLHRTPRIEQPTHLVFDLDPGEGADILSCANVALLVRDLLEGLKLKSFPKVSGSKGLQIYVPLNSRGTYDVAERFARAVAELLSRRNPQLVVAQMSKALRTGKVFIDWSQNTQSKTTVGVYSLRAKHPQPFVSMPVTWPELERAMDTGDSKVLFFPPGAALYRIKKHGDLFAPVLTTKQRLPHDFIDAAGAPSTPKELVQYAARRNFGRTTEPAPALRTRSAQGSRRRFVVQKHAAQHLHYDFRLEMHDVLKSWAVPKGMPVRPGETRSAFATEDHPLEYLEFEGIIPKDQYGGGTVMVWDIGSYDIVEGNYWRGHLTVFLSGEKLKGQWMLKRLDPNGSRDQKATWLLTKTDGTTKRIPASRADRSALTGRTMDEIAEEKTATWQTNRAITSIGAARRTQVKNQTPAAPAFIQPMKAVLVQRLPEGSDWIYEVKWDGYRALGSKRATTVQVRSLKNKDLGSVFPSVLDALRGIGADTALIDGEIVAIDDQGRPSFQALQNRSSLGRKWHVVYYAFDLLNLEGEDLRGQPLEHRRQRLQSLVARGDIRFSAALEGTPEAIVEAVRQAGLEGVIAKKKNSPYRSGDRSPDWQKLKLAPAQEFVIGGYNPEVSSFSSLLVGFYQDSRLMFAGKVRQGLNPALRSSLIKLMRPLIVKRCPFVNLPTSKTGHFGEGITQEDMAKLKWVRPKLVGQVSFTEWTSYGLLRHATFLGLRDDKSAGHVTRESPVNPLEKT